MRVPITHMKTRALEADNSEAFVTRTRTNSSAVLIVVCVLMNSLAAHAQDNRSVHFGVMGGATFPRGVLSDASRAGWNAGALVLFGTSVAPLSVRIEGQWHQLRRRDEVIVALPSIPSSAGFTAPVDFDFRAIDGTANAVYTIHPERPVNFYAIGGVGIYNERTTSAYDGARSSATKFGLNGGVGVKFGGKALGGFVEARFHNVFRGSDIGDFVKRGDKPESLQFIPISAGITF
jgi:hypothetical protein